MTIDYHYTYFFLESKYKSELMQSSVMLDILTIIGVFDINQPTKF